jgi:hypothetical protein
MSIEVENHWKRRIKNASNIQAPKNLILKISSWLYKSREESTHVNVSNKRILDYYGHNFCLKVSGYVRHFMFYLDDISNKDMDLVQEKIKLAHPYNFYKFGRCFSLTNDQEYIEGRVTGTLTFICFETVTDFDFLKINLKLFNPKILLIL